MMSLKRVIQQAEVYAAKKHEGQVDDEGKEFIDHPFKVADIITLVTDDPEVIAAAILHDTIEDTNATYEDIEEKFGKRIADLVLEVTHEGDPETGYYFPRLLSREATMIKFADRLHNLSRMNMWTEERKAHYVKRSKFWKDKKI